MMKDKEFAELSVLLLKQLEIQKKMLVLEERKKIVLVEGDINELDEILKQQTPLIFSCTSLEKQRKQLMTKMDLGEVPFREIMEQHAPNYDDTLLNKFEDLVKVLCQLKKVNDLNNKILQSRSLRNKQFLSILGMQEASLTYDENGHF